MSQASRGASIQLDWRIGVGVVALLLVILVAVAPELWQQGLSWLSRVRPLTAALDWALNLMAIALVVFILAALLIPLETLGWWAGWYGDEVDSPLDPGRLVENIAITDRISRYVIYLDGIAQSKFEYLPEAEMFVNELAAVLPDDILMIKGLMPYSPINRPLTNASVLAFFWRMADYFQVSRSWGLIGLLVGLTIQIRNIIVVAISADRRYGPIYNQGTAQVIVNSLRNHGYQPGSHSPITLIGYSGGAQISLAAAPFVIRALNAPVDVISIAGVFSGNNGFLHLEHLYHFVGDRDLVERFGCILFPKRWKVLGLSPWNRAKRMGKVTITSLGPVGHSSGGGPFDHQHHLPNGSTCFQQTIHWVAGILMGQSSLVRHPPSHTLSNYERYRQADVNQSVFYPLKQRPDPALYRAIAPWMGRLILPSPKERAVVRGVLLEVHHAPPRYRHLVGQIVILRWSNTPETQDFVQAATKDLHFSDKAEYSQAQGVIHPDRLNHWPQVDPLESLAGSHPIDDVIVALYPPVHLVSQSEAASPKLKPASSLLAFLPCLTITREPMQITGRFYALVHLLYPIAPGSDRIQVIHFNPLTRHFDGVKETIRIPQVIADANGCFPSVTQGMETSPANAAGWYIYGAADATGLFTVQAIAPRALLRLQPDAVITGNAAAWRYIKRQSWQTRGKKGHTRSVSLTIRPQAIAPAWKEGDRALLLHVYGGIGGKKREPSARTPIFFGHFAYGTATVVREPLANELIFDIRYHQVYTHNTDGIIAGTLTWPCYMGDRQFGWLGIRPVRDFLVKLDAFTGEFNVQGNRYSALDLLVRQLEQMTARYRIGDGTGGTYVGPAHNCAQDSNQALYATLRQMREAIRQNPDLRRSLQDDPGEAERYEQLVTLTHQIRRKLLPLGAARADWRDGKYTLGISPEEDLIQGVLTGLRSWRTLLPRLACETILYEFLQQGATIWVLETNQVGGYDPDVDSIAPTQIGW